MNSTTYVMVNLAALFLGQWLVTRGHWSGFLVWCAANYYGIVTCLLSGMPQTACLFGAYFLVNAGSLWSWWAKDHGVLPRRLKTRKNLAAPSA